MKRLRRDAKQMAIDLAAQVRPHDAQGNEWPPEYFKLVVQYLVEALNWRESETNSLSAAATPLIIVPKAGSNSA